MYFLTRDYNQTDVFALESNWYKNKVICSLYKMRLVACLTENGYLLVSMFQFYELDYVMEVLMSNLIHQIHP